MSTAEALCLDIRVAGLGRIGTGESLYIFEKGRVSRSEKPWLEDSVNTGEGTQFMRGP